ncbi:hypothetical protein OH76DRAFT_1192756 [Lentinus brumalis]|uniref:Uncharacterized protein n=1 Tax=Lentinus brumalis TaxID=2498619 RepID=A0A371CTM8_9APHY|nr:hypothetical protein OH76DRAFT_1192756 [Polyporus brumalis]
MHCQRRRDAYNLGNAVRVLISLPHLNTNPLVWTRRTPSRQPGPTHQVVTTFSRLTQTVLTWRCAPSSRPFLQRARHPQSTADFISKLRGHTTRRRTYRPIQTRRATSRACTAVVS